MARSIWLASAAAWVIDQVGYLDDAISYTAKSAGLSKPMTVRYEDNPTLSELLLGAQSRWAAAPPA